MKKIVILLLLIFTLCGCTIQNQGVNSDTVTKPSHIADQSSGTADSQKEKTDAEKTNRVSLDLSDPFLYAKNLPQEIGSSVWRTRKSQYPGLVQSISKEYLCSTTWYSCGEECETGLILMFFLDDEFKIGTLQGGIELTGKYRVIENNKVEVYEYACDKDTLAANLLPSFFSGDKWTLKFETDANNFWYSDHLYGINQKYYFGALGSEPPAGKVYKVNGFDIIKEEWEAVTNSRVKFRTKPMQNAETIKIGFVYQYDIVDHTRLDYLLKGAKFTVLGKTIDKIMIDGKENHWYYIRYNDFEFATYGWVFGEAVEPYQKDKANAYHSMYAKEIDSIAASS